MPDNFAWRQEKLCGIVNIALFSLHITAILVKVTGQSGNYDVTNFS